MTGNPLRMLTAALGLALVACASAAPSAREAAMSNLETRRPPEMMPVKEWPLRFKRHSFGAYTYDTYGARVIYAGQVQIYEDGETLQRPSSSYGPDYQSGWSGTHGMISNFPAPALVTWRSRDGSAHEAKIDFGKIFEDETIRHNVALEEVGSLPGGEYVSEPEIVMEINDRQIHIFMRAMIMLKKRVHVAGVERADMADEWVLVKQLTF